MTGKRVPWQPDDLTKIVLPQEAQISPSGRRVAYVRSRQVRAWDAAGESIHVAFLDRNNRVLEDVVIAGGHTPRWSPDGRYLAYLADEPVAKREQVAGFTEAQQLHIVDIDSLDREKTSRIREKIWTMTSGPRDVIEFDWAPDGQSLVICQAELHPDDPGASKIGRRTTKLPRVRRITRAGHSLDSFGRTADDSTYYGYTYEFAWNLALLDANSGELRHLTTGRHSNSSPHWSPDGKQIAFVTDRDSPSDDIMRADVWVMNSDGTDAHRVSLDEGVSCWSSPAWSPDGTHLAFVGSTYPNWEGHEDLYVMRADGANLVNITAGQPFTAGDQGLADVSPDSDDFLQWSADGASIIFTASQEGSVQLKRAELDRNRQRAKRFTDVTSGEHRICGASISKRGKIALVKSTWENPGDLYIQSPSSRSMQRITKCNDKLLASRITHVPRPLPVTTFDGRTVQAWSIRSELQEADVPGPTVLMVHGGPAAMYGAGFFHEWQVLAGSGYNIVFGNPRGSTGYGKEWSVQVFGDVGGGDFRDCMAIADAAEAAGLADPARFAIEGGSYGGFMANWAIGQTNRFAAAVAGRSISNWQSFWGTSDGGRHAEDELGGTPWEVTGEYLRRSPISYVTNVRTPLLLMHSDHDLRCPLEQSQQMFQALKRLGQDVELHIAENASHELSRSGSTRQRLIRIQTIREWYDKHLHKGVAAQKLAEQRRVAVVRINAERGERELAA